MIALMDPEVGAKAPVPLGTAALRPATAKVGGGGTAEKRRPVRHPATAKVGGGGTAEKRRPVRHPATAKGSPSGAERTSVRRLVTSKGGVSVGERSRRSIPVGPHRV
ncbi:hypothetical protein ACFYO0_25765 [Streptomyces sp. NPDC006365]|uniref:hypothetical protein n=1 Tax=Streptomyces sp. NPDC006365 TaxID=3364744 RepID=UPI0036D0044E